DTHDLPRLLLPRGAGREETPGRRGHPNSALRLFSSGYRRLKNDDAVGARGCCDAVEVRKRGDEGVGVACVEGAADGNLRDARVLQFDPTVAVPADLSDRLLDRRRGEDQPSRGPADFTGRVD